MVMCVMEEVSIPKPPALPAALFRPRMTEPSQKSAKSQGFRLVDDQGDTGSVYSVYKQKIDAMFESDSSTNTNNNNSVQARIEKMFTDVALDSGVPLIDIGCHNFSVDYLGSVPLHEKVTSLAGLQAPLKELYFAYKRNTKHKKTLTGRLEISSSGLKVQYQGEKGDLEQLNSFPTIAVWSAVKFVLQDKNTSYAFLPLITDPDNIDKQTLFRGLDSNEKKYITNESHSPLFAVVMRKIGVHKQLECHGFLCQTSEDAIVIAATLYKSLMAHMKAKEKKPKNKNGITCMSIASSVFNESANPTPVRPPRKKRSTTSSNASDKDAFDISESQPLIQDSRNNKIPKKSTKTRRAPKAPNPPKEDLDAILPYEEPIKPASEAVDQIGEIKPKTLADKWNTYMSNQQKQIAAEIKQVISEAPNRGLKSVAQAAPRRRDDDSILSNKSTENSGDILTKVTIPRSGSFLNAGGLTRYKSKVYRANGQASGGSPLGFNELFQEFRLQEGLHSMDEILGVIIDPEGMSFNDLKPIYKEFLLKLAVTLTKDELYQRSKSIMRRQKKKLLRRNTLLMLAKKRHLVVSPKFKRLKHIFRKSMKLKVGGRDDKFCGVVGADDVPAQIDSKLPESSISTSSYDTRQFRPKEVAAVAKKANYKRRSGEFKTNGGRTRRDRASTSEESDFFSLRRGKGRNSTAMLPSSTQNRNSSSGYVSCSECSYDSDTCTCISADKCYCSLGNKNFNKRLPPRCPSTCRTEEKCYCSLETVAPTWCGCDTDSCTDSNKCYCQYVNARNGTIFEQLKQRGFIPSPETVLTPPNHKKLCKKNSNTKSTRSLEYMHNPNEKYYEKLRQRNNMTILESARRGSSAVDYELFAFSNNLRNGNNRGVYARAMSDTGNYGKHHSGSIRSYNSAQNHPTRGRMLQSTTIPADACTEALSVKKSAEIAALFADIKLSQTTDIAHLVPKNSEIEKFFAGRNAYKNVSPTKAYAKLNKTKSEPPCSGSRFVNNPLYTSKNNQKMYSARNGLYTIQSQSDESRRSSVSENGRQKDGHDYFNLGEDEKIAGSSLENSLGYLP